MEQSDVWRYYEEGRQYNNRLIPNQYNVVNTNIEFFAGNQWINVPDTEAMRKLARPTFNIIKRVTSLFVASLTSSNTTISFEPLSYQDDSDAASFATAEVRNLLEKFKMDYRIREALFDGAITGDYAAHFFWNPDARPYGGAFGDYRGEIEMELVDGINIMFGNPNSCDVESQPYILVVGRDTVANLRREAARWHEAVGRSAQAVEGGAASSLRTTGYGLRPEDYDIKPDSEFETFSGIGGKTELYGDDDRTGKALYVYMYTKARNLDGSVTVHVTKATKSANIFEDVDTGLSRYPIAWGNWQKQKNQYHGRALVTEIIPNQIFINQMMAMVFRHLQTQAFPTKIFNADLLPGLSNEVGAAIGVRNLLPGQDLGTVISTLPAADMSSQIVAVIDKVMEYTKECLGATDAQMGNIHPDNTSAIMVLQNASEVPLENTKAGLNEWVEDIGAILLDMIGTYYGLRPIMKERTVEEIMTGIDGQPLIDPMTGKLATSKNTERILENFDFSVFKHLWLNISVDVGATTYYSEIAMVQTLDNLRHDGTLDVIEYLERLPDKLITRKQDLIASLREKLKGGEYNEEEVQALSKTKTPNRSVTAGGGLDSAKKLAQLPASIQGRYNSLPKTAQRALINM